MHPDSFSAGVGQPIFGALSRVLPGLFFAATAGPVWAQPHPLEATWFYGLGLLFLIALTLALVVLNRSLIKAREQIGREMQWRDQLMAELPVGVYELLDEPSGLLRFEFVSDRAQQMFGVSRAELEADFLSVFRHFHPDDVARVKSLNQQARSAGVGFQATARVVQGQHIRWIRIQSRPRQEGSRRRWAGIVSDVTEGKEAELALAENERLLSSMSQLTNTGGWQLDVASGTVRWTEQTFVIHDLPQDKDPPLDQALSFYTNEDRQRLERALNRAMECGEGYDLTLRMITAAGHERIARSLCRPLIEDGRVVRLDGAFQDVTDLVAQERKVREAEQRFRAMLEQAPIGILLHEVDSGLILDGNAEAWALFGADSLEALVQAQDRIWCDPPYDAQEARARIQRAVTEGRQQFDWRSRRLDGQERWMQVTLTPICMDGQNRVLAGCIDITLRRETERLLQQSDERFRTLLMDVPEVAIQGYRLDGGVHYWNRASERLYGYSEAEALQSNLLDLIIPPEQRQMVRETLRRVAAGGSIENGELELMRKDGSRVTVFSSHTVLRREGQPTELFCLDIDLSERKRQEMELARIANYDALTGLPNRNVLGELMRQHCARVQRSSERLAICYLDLDEFKPINDGYGHDLGDRVLIEVASRLRSLVRDSDTVARLGGDEFVLLLAGFADDASMQQGLQTVLDRIAEPMFIESLQLQVSCSIGVTLYPDDDGDPDTLLRHADQAMYRAKLQGRNRYSLFDPRMEEGVQVRRARLREIQQALAEGAFDLYFQPQIDLRSGAAVGMEGLVRWNHPQRGLLAPDQFMAELTHSEVEASFGGYVIERGLSQLASWLDQGLILTLSINVSGAHLLTPGFVGQLRAALERFPRVPASLLQLEIVESAAVADLDRAIAVVDRIRLAGVQVSLDDFGTGYSSLSHLRSLPVDEVKIDRDFVGNMLSDLSDYSIVRSVIGLAGAFGLRVVAEGVETIEHAHVLMDLGCEYGQGFVFGRPMPPAAVSDWLRSWKGRADTIAWGRTESSVEATSLSIAISTHRHWLRRIHETVRGQRVRDSEISVDARHCILGRWLEDEGRRLHGHLPDFEKAVHSHERVHIQADELLAQAEGGPECWLRPLRRLDAESQQLIKRLQSLNPAQSASSTSS